VRLRRYALLLAVLLLSLFLLTVQARGGGPTRAADLVALAITPVQSLLAKAHRGALGAWHTFADWKAVRSENLALRGDNERLRVQSLQVRETDQESSHCRFARPTRRTAGCAGCSRCANGCRWRL